MIVCSLFWISADRRHTVRGNQKTHYFSHLPELQCLLCDTAVRSSMVCQWFSHKTANVTATVIRANSPLDRIDFMSTVIVGSAALSQFWTSPQVRHHHQLLRFVAQHRKPPRRPVLEQLPVSCDRGSSLPHRLVTAAVLFETLLPIFHTLSRRHSNPLCPSHPNR